MSTFYAMHRGWMKSPVFKKEPYTEREAWEWIISETSYLPREVSIKGQAILLSIGQLSHSVRFMSDKWGWTKSKVSRYLKKLEKWKMIEIKTDAGQSVITVCNYKKYQKMGIKVGTGAGQERDRSGTKKNKDNKYNKIIPPISPAEIPQCIPKNLWIDYQQHRKQKKESYTDIAETRALNKLQRWHEDGVNVTAVIEMTLEKNWLGFVHPDDLNNKGNYNGKYTTDDALHKVLGELEANSPYDTPMLCNSEHLQQDTKTIRNSNESDGRGLVPTPDRGNKQSLSEMEKN